MSEENSPLAQFETETEIIDTDILISLKKIGSFYGTRHMSFQTVMRNNNLGGKCFV